MWRVPALAIPPPVSALEPENLAHVKAVALFLDRARAHQPGFALDRRPAPAVVTICQHSGNSLSQRRT